MKHRPGPKIASVAYPSLHSPGSIWMAVGNPTEPLFGWLLLRSRRQERAHSMPRDVGAPRVIGLFGELFGGAYLLPDVAALPHATLSKLPCADTDAPLGLPPIADNIAEGLVLKPDARLPVEKRLMRKKKTAEFDDARFEEAPPFQSNAMLTIEELAAHAKHLVNDARIASACSKVRADAEAVRDEVVLDVLIDLDATSPLAYWALNAEQEDEIQSLVDALALARVTK